MKEALTARGNDVLPLVLVDERIAVEGAYPSRETLAALANVVVRKPEAAPTAGGCCGPKTADADAKEVEVLLNAKDAPWLASSSIRRAYLFFTGKGGVGKTSVACATAIALAGRGTGACCSSAPIRRRTSTRSSA